MAIAGNFEYNGVKIYRNAWLTGFGIRKLHTSIDKISRICGLSEKCH